MSTLIIRNVDETLKTRLRIRAAQHGQSMEEEVRFILRRELLPPTPTGGLGTRLVSRFRDVAGDLPLPERSLPRASIPWDGSE
jgi:antitoxin FitA